jgi:hypothetical protein
METLKKANIPEKKSVENVNSILWQQIERCAVLKSEVLEGR